MTIGNGVTRIEEGAFAECTSLTKVTIGDNVTSIGYGAFGGCTGLTSVVIPDSVTSMGWEAFDGCINLTSSTIPRSVTSIESGTFSRCTGITSITIPASVASIGWAAFNGCAGLTSVYFQGRPPSLHGLVFYDANKVRVYYLPGATGWGPTFGDRSTALWISVMPNLPSVAADNPLRLTTHSPAPATVRVQRSANLVGWADWQTVSRDKGPSELQDTVAGSTAYRFYPLLEQ